MTHPLPALHISLEAITHNSRVLTERLGAFGITVAGVVKGCCGSPQVAAAMLAGGVSDIADSRLENLVRLRRNGVDAPLWLLRLPMISQAEEVVEYADVSLNSDLRTLQALSHAAGKRGRVHKVLLMVDVGDRREGVMPAEVVEYASEILTMPNLELIGIGTNLGCFGGVLPTEKDLGLLAATADEVEERCKIRLQYVSGGNSNTLLLAMAGKVPRRINHLRLGESILLGRETAHGNALEFLRQDGFTLAAEVIESEYKPAAPEGEQGLDAFGNPVRQGGEEGFSHRLILGIGREDTVPEQLIPQMKGIRVLGGSSDHLICSADDAESVPQAGDVLKFYCRYAALLGAMTSAYVTKEFVDVADAGSFHGTVLFAPEELHPAAELYCQNDQTAQRATEYSLDAAQLALKEMKRPVFLGDTWFAKDAGMLSRLGLDPALTGVLFFSARAPISARALGFPDENVAYIGFRQLSAVRRNELRQSRSILGSMADIDADGIAPVVRESCRALGHCREGIFVIWSMDVVDPGVTRDILAPVRGGLDFREAHTALELVAPRRVAGAVFCGVAGVDGDGWHLAADFLQSLLGKTIL